MGFSPGNSGTCNNFAAIGTCPRISHGFTLIELLIVLTVIGLLAAYAIPKYLDISTHAKISVCKGVLANIRASLLLHHYEARIQGVDTWPTLKQVQDNEDNTGSGIMQYGDLPNNPFSTGKRRDWVVAVDQKPKPWGTQGAWAYNPKTGQFWADTDSGNGEVDF